MWKEQHANDSQRALDHPLCKEVREEFLQNLARCCGVSVNDALVRYGINKVQMYAAQVARAQALGFDPDALRATPGEHNAAMLDLAERAVRAGKPVIIVESVDGDAT